MCNNLRGRVYNTLKVKGYKKNIKTEKILGASFKVVKSHIENQFKDGMNWNNNTRKGWHIDHIIPISSAKTEEELIKLFYYKNLQPLWARDNRKKGNKIKFQK